MCKQCKCNPGNTLNQKAYHAALQTLRRAGKLKEVKGQYYVPVEEEVIRETAEKFLAGQGFVTTLQIKDHLRKNNYFVKQSDVSDVLTEMFNEGDILFTNVNSNGKDHRLFYTHGTPAGLAVLAFMAS